MKNVRFLVLFATAIISLNGCDPEKTGAGKNLPPITLLGEKVDTAYLNTQYIQPNPAALIEIEGSRREDIKVTGSVNTTVPGTYYLDYDYSDAEGNRAATITRTVHVVMTSQDTVRLLETYELFKKIDISKSWEQIGKNPQRIELKISSQPLVYLEYTDGNALRIYNVANVKKGEGKLILKTTSHFGDTLCYWTIKKTNNTQTAWTIEKPVIHNKRNLGLFNATD